MSDFRTKEFTVLTPFSVVTKDAVEVTDLTCDNVIKIAGYANWAGNDDYGKTYVDLTGDVVVPSGVDTSVWSSNPQILWQHDREETIGVGLKLEKRQDGIYIEAEIHRDAMEDKEWYRIKSGLVKMFSVGFRTQDGEFKEIDGESVFFITKCLLLEVSVVSIPANSKSSFSQIKSLGDGGFTADKIKFMEEDELKPQLNNKEETAMTTMKVKRAEVVGLDAFKGLGEDTEVEVSIADFIKGIVAREVSAALAAKEKEAQEAAAAQAEADALKAAEEEAAKAAQLEAEAKAAEEAAQLEAEAKAAAETAEVEELKSIIATLKSALAVEEK